MVRLVVVVFLAAGFMRVARADPSGAGPPGAAPELVQGQRSIGIGAELGLNTGLGLALHVGTPWIGLYIAGGIMPVFIIGRQHDPSSTPTFDIYRAFELNADLYAMFIHPTPRTDLGLSGGYSGNTFLGNGANLGIAVRYALNAKLAFTIFGGLEYFPDASGHLTAHDYPTTQDAVRPQIQGGFNVGIVFYP